MANSENSRAIRFPKELWDVIDEDAKRCKRNWVQQMEMILSVYYGFEEKEPDIDAKRISQMRSGVDSGKPGNQQSKERLLKSIDFGKTTDANNENSIDEEALIYQGKALYRQNQAQGNVKDKK